MSRSLERVRVTSGGVEGPWRREGVVVVEGFEDEGEKSEGEDGFDILGLILWKQKFGGLASLRSNESFKRA